jgi:hypothetical protein
VAVREETAAAAIIDAHRMAGIVRDAVDRPRELRALGLRKERPVVLNGRPRCSRCETARRPARVRRCAYAACSDTRELVCSECNLLPGHSCATLLAERQTRELRQNEQMAFRLALKKPIRLSRCTNCQNDGAVA